MDPQLQQSGIFVLVIFLAVLVERGWQWMRRRRARAWPAAEGRVYTADWRQPRTGTRRYFVGSLSYSYLAGGHFYSGYHRRSFSSEADACEWVRRMEQARLQVRYDPRAAGRSVLLEAEQTYTRVEAPELAESEYVAAGD